MTVFLLPAERPESVAAALQPFTAEGKFRLLLAAGNPGAYDELRDDDQLWIVVDDLDAKAPEGLGYVQRLDPYDMEKSPEDQLQAWVETALVGPEPPPEEQNMTEAVVQPIDEGSVEIVEPKGDPLVEAAAAANDEVPQEVETPDLKPWEQPWKPYTQRGFKG